MQKSITVRCPNEVLHQVYLCQSVLEESVHYAQCVVAAKLQKEPPSACITMFANHTLSCPTFVFQCVHWSLPEWSWIRQLQQFERHYYSLSTNSACSALEFGTWTCIKLKQRSNNLNMHTLHPNGICGVSRSGKPIPTVSLCEIVSLNHETLTPVLRCVFYFFTVAFSYATASVETKEKIQEKSLTAVPNLLVYCIVSPTRLALRGSILQALTNAFGYLREARSITKTITYWRKYSLYAMSFIATYAEFAKENRYFAWSFCILHLLFAISFSVQSTKDGNNSLWRIMAKK